MNAAITTNVVENAQKATEKMFIDEKRKERVKEAVKKVAAAHKPEPRKIPEPKKVVPVKKPTPPKGPVKTAPKKAEKKVVKKLVMGKVITLSGFKIEKGIAIPEGHFTRDSMYPFKDMEVGDSFAINHNDARKISSASAQWGRRRNMKFSVRRSGSAFRCWRVS